MWPDTICSTCGNDTKYWRAARQDMVLPERLQQLLECWGRNGDFSGHLQMAGADKVYSNASWYCLLAGMGRFPKTSLINHAESEKLICDVQSFCEGNVARFEAHRDYLERLAAR